jgi:hypothetical protein
LVQQVEKKKTRRTAEELRSSKSEKKSRRTAEESRTKLLRDAYICSKNVANEGKQLWFLFTEKLLKFIGIQDKFRFFKFHKFTKTCKKNCYIKKICKTNWYIKKNCFLDGKLTTYFKLKQNFGFETYTKNFEYRRSILYVNYVFQPIN